MLFDRLIFPQLTWAIMQHRGIQKILCLSGLAAASIALLILSIAYLASDIEPRAKDSFQKFSPSVVALTYNADRHEGLEFPIAYPIWSGFLIDRKGTILTAAHPLSNHPGEVIHAIQSSAWNFSGNSRRLFSYKIQFISQESDLAILKPTGDFPRPNNLVSLKGSHPRPIGSRFAAIAIFVDRFYHQNKSHIQKCLLQGRTIASLEDAQYIGLDSLIMNGMSGGLVIDSEDNRLLGVLSNVSMSNMSWSGRAGIRVYHGPDNILELPYRIGLFRYSKMIPASQVQKILDEGNSPVDSKAGI